MRTVTIALLLALTLSQTTLFLSGPSTTSILSPAGYTLVNEAYHNANNPNFLGNGATWVYLNGSSSWPLGHQATFQALFYVDCPQNEATLKITADDQFKAVLNGNSIGSGNNWQKVFDFIVKLQCGWNNLTIITNNLWAYSPAAVVFSVHQFQKGCFDCSANPTAFYSRKTCKCECSSECPCKFKLHQWYNFPTCGCKCRRQVLLECKPSTHFWSEETCSCLCKPKWCPAGFAQDASTCQCLCNEEKCPTGQQWNNYKCQCEKKRCAVTECQKGKFWHEKTCSCDCPALYVDCKQGQNQQTCECNSSPTVSTSETAAPGN